MLIARRMALGLVTLALVSCSQAGLKSRIEFGSRVGAGAELNGLKRWNFVPTQFVPTGNPRLDDPANLQLLEDIIASELSKRGMERITSGDSLDFVVSYEIGFQKKYDDPDWINGYKTEFKHQSDVKTSWETGNLTIFLFEAGTGQAMWAGWGSGELDPRASKQQARSNLRKVIEEIFTKFDTDQKKDDDPAVKTDYKAVEE
jgi:hypothetical protein